MKIVQTPKKEYVDNEGGGVSKNRSHATVKAFFKNMQLVLVYDKTPGR